MRRWFDWSKPRGGVATVAGVLIFGGTSLLITGGNSPYTRWVAPSLLLPVGIGLWLKHGWARWAGFVLHGLIALTLPFAIAEKGFSLRYGLTALVIAFALHTLWKWDVYGEAEALDELMQRAQKAVAQAEAAELARADTEHRE